MSKLAVVKIGRGVGPLLFGASRPEVARLLGPPEDRELIEDEGDETLDYLNGELSLSFERDSFWRFVSCECSSSSTVLNGVPIVGRPLEQVLIHLERLEMGQPEQEYGPDELLSSYSDAALMLWSKAGVVISVAWGVRHDSEDRELWPDRGDGAN